MGLQMAGARGMDRDRGRDNNQQEWHYPVGQFLDRFQAGEQPGLVMVQASGNAYMRELAEGESILIKPPALLFKDPTVGMQLHVEYPAAGMKLWRTWGNRYLWLRVWCPGRVGPAVLLRTPRRPGHGFPRPVATYRPLVEIALHRCGWAGSKTVAGRGNVVDAGQGQQSCC